MVTEELLLLDNNGNFTGPGTVTLPQAFFNPSVIANNGIDPILKGLSIQFQEEIDAMITEELRTFLFMPNPGPGLDLAALNIQRGRDHGLADYNAYRNHFTGTTANSFADITSDLTLQGKLASVYNDINEIDLWVGALSEDKLPNAEVGPTLHAMLTEQFSRIRDGDYYFYRNDPSLIYDVAAIEDTKLSDVIKRNTTITNIQDHVFEAESDCVDNLYPSGTMANTIYPVKYELHCSGMVQNGGHVVFKAGDRIKLLNGFSIKNNASFKAKIEFCQ